MKSFILFIFPVFFSLSIQSQGTGFKEFIELSRDNLNEFPETCNRYFGHKPLKDDYRESYYKILKESESYIGILFSDETYDYGYQRMVTLTTYDWNGNYINKIEFESELSGDYITMVKKCEFNNDIIDCTISSYESALEYLYNEKGDIIGTDYVNTKTATYIEKYIIKPDGQIIPFDSH